jgi:hypothetical protein
VSTANNAEILHKPTTTTTSTKSNIKTPSPFKDSEDVTKNVNNDSKEAKKVK